jgi:glycosyltransferase involved in cell wall biosynthesis
LRLAVDLSHLCAGGESGGVKPFVLEYLRELAALEGRQLTLILLTCSASHAEIRELARPHDELVCVRHNSTVAIETLGNWRNGEIFLPEPPANLLLLLQANLLYAPLISTEFACPGIPTISTVVDVLHRDYPATLPHEANVHREALFKELVRVSELLQCISEYTAGQMTRHYAVPADRMFCSHIAIHQRFATPPVEQPGQGNYFFYPANSWPHKNHETLLVAYRQYRHHAGADAWRLVLTGHDDDRMRQILMHANHLGLHECVSFHGHLPAAEFTRLWHEAGALVFPSLHEGFGIPLLEAMHFQVPILCSRAGALPEVAGEAALFADALDPTAWAKAMLQMAGSSHLRQELAAKGQKRLAEFSLAGEISEFRQAIHATVTTPPRRWRKGVHVDGWIENLALLGLPAKGPLRIELNLAPGPASRRVRLYRGLVPLGGFEAPAGVAVGHLVETEAGGGPLAIEVPDAANLNPSDHRRHGVILLSANAVDSLGRNHNLLEDES